MQIREGSLSAPVRHPLGHQTPEFYDEQQLLTELDRVFDICHGCRRCFNLCGSFPTLFDAIDETDSFELEDVDRQVYAEIIDNCYQCDLCFQTKCPYVPPHEWNIDFPHLMVRAKAVRFKKGQSRFRDRLITSTDRIGQIVTKSRMSGLVTWANSISWLRWCLEKLVGIHKSARLPEFHNRTLSRRIASRPVNEDTAATGELTSGSVALFSTCYGEYNLPSIGEDLIKIFEHNGVKVQLVQDSHCCGMPKFDLGDLDAVTRLKEHNIPLLADLVDQGCDLLALVPSCTLMFKQELPLMYPDDPQVAKVSKAMFDPFEYLMLRHKELLLNTEFRNPLGKVAYHVACHQRVQNIGPKTRDILQLIPGTEVTTIERCSGHDGTYAVKAERHDMSIKICRPVAKSVTKAQADYYTSDCAMAGTQIESVVADGSHSTHPLTLLRLAYGL